MHADLEQDIDGKLWLLVDGPDGKAYKIAHETATAPPPAPARIVLGFDPAVPDATSYTYYRPYLPDRNGRIVVE